MVSTSSTCSRGLPSRGSRIRAESTFFACKAKYKESLSVSGSPASTRVGVLKLPAKKRGECLTYWSGSSHGMAPIHSMARREPSECVATWVTKSLIERLAITGGLLAAWAIGNRQPLGIYVAFRDHEINAAHQVVE